MLTLEEARGKVVSLLQEWNEGKSGPHKLIILDEHTMERSWGWVFFYTSQGWRDGDLSDAIGGNAPFIVNRYIGAIENTGTARPVELYVQNYELTGDPYARPGSQVVIESANAGADIIAAVRLLRAFSEWSAGQIKGALDAVIGGKSFVVQAESISAAETLVANWGLSASSAASNLSMSPTKRHEPTLPFVERDPAIEALCEDDVQRTSGIRRRNGHAGWENVACYNWEMTTEQLRSALRSSPFRPFTIRMADGRTFSIAHPDFLSMSPAGRTVVVYHPDDSASIVDLLLMTELELSPPSGSPA